MNLPFRWEEPAMIADDRFLAHAKAYAVKHSLPDYPDDVQCLPCWDTKVMEVAARHANKRHVITVTDWTGPRYFAPCHCLGHDPDPAVVARLVESVLAERIPA